MILHIGRWRIVADSEGISVSTVDQPHKTLWAWWTPTRQTHRRKKARR